MGQGSHDRGLEVTTSIDDATVVIRACGEIDIGTIAPLEGALAECCPGAELVRVDLTEVDFADASAVRLLVAAGRRCRDDGAQLVVEASPAVLRTIEVLRPKLAGALSQVLVRAVA